MYHGFEFFVLLSRFDYCMYVHARIFLSLIDHKHIGWMKFGTQARLLNEMAVTFQNSSATMTRRRDYLTKCPSNFCEIFWN